MSNINKAKTISSQTDVPLSDVRKVLDALDNYSYPNGTVLRAYEGANMAIRTPDGWRAIPNTSFATGRSPLEDRSVWRWQVVYNPDTFQHQEHIGDTNGDFEVIA